MEDKQQSSENNFEGRIMFCIRVRQTDEVDKNNNEEITNLTTFIEDSFDEMLLNKIKTEVAKVVDGKLNELIESNGNIINPTVKENTNDNLLNSLKSEISFLRKSLE